MIEGGTKRKKKLNCHRQASLKMTVSATIRNDYLSLAAADADFRLGEGRPGKFEAVRGGLLQRVPLRHDQQLDLRLDLLEGAALHHHHHDHHR